MGRCCWYETRSGKRCKNRESDDGDYCWMHWRIMGKRIRSVRIKQGLAARKAFFSKVRS